MLQREYWRAAAAEFRSVRSLTVAALMTALTVAVGSLFIPVADNLRLMFTYIPMSVGGMVCGPLMAMVIGLVSDLVGFVIHPTGAFFPGYTLSAVLGALAYGLAFYRQRPNIWRVLIVRGLVNLLVNAALGSVWSAVLMGKAYMFYLGKSLFKNIALLPIEAFIIHQVFRFVTPMLERMRMVHLPPAPTKKSLRKEKDIDRRA